MAGSFPTVPMAGTAPTDQFGLGGLNDALAGQEQKTAARQQAEVEAQKVETRKTADLARIAGKTVEIHQDLLDQLQPLAATVNSVSQARAEQQKLTTSNNPLDFFTAVGNKILNPKMYTEKGQDQTIQDATQIANVQTFIAGQKTSALSSAAEAVTAGALAAQAPLNQAKLLEQQGQESINQKLLEVQTRGKLLADNAQMANTVMATASEAAIRAANQTASQTGQPVSIGGIQIQPGMLQSRVDQLDDRQTMIDSKRLSTQEKNEALTKKLNLKILGTMNPEELRGILAGNDQTSQYDLSDVKQTYDIKMQAQTDGIQRLQQAGELADFDSNTILPAQANIDRMTPTIPPGPAKTALDSYKTTTHVFAGVTAQYKQAWINQNPGVDPNTPEAKAAQQAAIPIDVKIAANKAISDQAEELDKQIQKQATLNARGDQNVKDILTEVYRGNPAPQASVEAAISTSLTKGLPISVLPPDVSKKATQIYNDTFSAGMKANAMAPFPEPKEVIQQRAVQAAIAGSVNDRLTQRSNDLMANQLDDPSNPLNGKMSKSSLISTQANADQSAIRNFKSGNGFTDEQMAVVLSGVPDPTKGVTQDKVLQFQAARQTEFFLALDGIQQGLAGDYAKWWSDKGGAYINKRSQESATAAAAGGLQSSSLEAYAGPMEKQQSSAYANHVVGTFDGSYDQAIQKRYGDLVSFNQDPKNRQAALLQLDGDLTDSERKEVMKNFILPLTNQAKAQKLSYGQTNVSIEQALAHANKNGVSDLQGAVDTPLLGRALKKLANNRVKVVDNLESIMTQPFWGKHDPSLPFGPNAIQTNQNWLAGQTSRRNYQWFHEAEKESR